MNSCVARQWSRAIVFSLDTFVIHYSELVLIEPVGIDAGDRHAFVLCDQRRKVAVAHRDNQKQGNVQCGILTPSRASLVQGDGVFGFDFSDPQ